MPRRENKRLLLDISTIDDPLDFFEYWLGQIILEHLLKGKVLQASGFGLAKDLHPFDPLATFPAKSSEGLEERM
jgi:hypothetical protein